MVKPIGREKDFVTSHYIFRSALPTSKSKLTDGLIGRPRKRFYYCSLTYLLSFQLKPKSELAMTAFLAVPTIHWLHIAFNSTEDKI